MQHQHTEDEGKGQEGRWLVPSAIWHWPTKKKNCAQNHRKKFLMSTSAVSAAFPAVWRLWLIPLGILFFFLEGNKEEEKTASTQILVFPEGQIVK